MKKLTEFLEKNCQWLAIALGAAYLLWMVYSFLLTSTAWQVSVANEPKSPGEVDEAVAKIADQLKAQMDSKTIPPIKVPDLGFSTNLSPKSMPEYSLAWANSPTQDVQLPVAPDATAGTKPLPGPNPKVAGAMPGKVIELPKAPAATDLFISSGRSNVVIPPPPPAVAANGEQPAQPARGPGRQRNRHRLDHHLLQNLDRRSRQGISAHADSLGPATGNHQLSRSRIGARRNAARWKLGPAGRLPKAVDVHSAALPCG